MYYYILDLGNKQIVRMKEKMEVLMASLGVSGDFGKISPLSSAYELANRAKESGYTTVVAIGGSEIINQVASALVNSETALGIIPISAPPTLSQLTGTDSLKEALEILRTRKIETIDVGKVAQSKYFLTEAKIKNPHPVATILDFGDFKIGGSFKEITIANGSKLRESFKDGLFDIKIDSKESKGFLGGLFKKASPVSLLHQESLKIESEEQTNVLIDEEVVAKTPCEINLLPLSLKLIISRLH